MKTFSLYALVVVLLAGVLWMCNDYYIKWKFRKRVALKYKAVESLVEKLDTRASITADEIDLMIKNPSIRYAVYWILESFKRGDLFPTEYFTHEKGAESVLVNWLEFPTELGMPPNEIELLEKVTIHSELVDYYVFRYRTLPPHWGSNWMIGVSGPYKKETRPYDMPSRVFSRFYTQGAVSPETEATWVHENIKGKWITYFMNL